MNEQRNGTSGGNADRMLHPDEARAIVLASVHRLGSERAPLAEAAGRVLAEDAVAEEPQPPFAAATMDGFAVVAGDASPWREVLGNQTAGFVLPAGLPRDRLATAAGHPGFQTFGVRRASRRPMSAGRSADAPASVERY
ncbi:MAG: hypothetical protein ACKOWF_03640, partial [Chloroflexota bacterium]